jgi:hypothetical protein
MTTPDGYLPRDGWHPTAADRGHHGLDGPPCPQRAHLDQRSPAGGPPAQAMCVHCGRVTARRGPDGQPACEGDPPNPQPKEARMRSTREDKPATAAD